MESKTFAAYLRDLFVKSDEREARQAGADSSDSQPDLRPLFLRIMEVDRFCLLRVLRALLDKQGSFSSTCCTKFGIREHCLVVDNRHLLPCYIKAFYALCPSSVMQVRFIKKRNGRKVCALLPFHRFDKELLLCCFLRRSFFCHYFLRRWFGSGFFCRSFRRYCFLCYHFFHRRFCGDCFLRRSFCSYHFFCRSFRCHCFLRWSFDCYFFRSRFGSGFGCSFLCRYFSH